LLSVATAVAARAQTLTTLASFNVIDGQFPEGPLVQGKDGNFYGETSYGGAGDHGIIFKITPQGTLTTLYSFCAQYACSDGATPSSGLVQGTDGNFYGTTGCNGQYGHGTVFKLTPQGALTTLYRFGWVDGAYPCAGLTQGADGNFYGTTSFGGVYVAPYFPGGTVFRITPTGTLTTLYSFCAQSGCADGKEPLGLTQGTDGNFYGTTFAGGANGNYGTIFKLTPEGTLTTLYSFCAQSGCIDGYYPLAIIQGTDGNFYGTTTEDEANRQYGTVFKLTLQGALTTLYSFCTQNYCTDGDNPGGLIQGTDGNFYGMTGFGGANENGSVFKITPEGALTTLYSFCSLIGCRDGERPGGRITQGTDGNFYGTTYYGGTDGVGIVFSLALRGAPVASISPARLAFGSWANDNTSAAENVMLTNTGTTPLSFFGVTFTGANAGDFAQTDTCSTSVDPGMSCYIQVTFTPSTLGAETATLNFNDNAANSPQTVALSGTGSAPVLLGPASGNLGVVPIHTPSQTATFTLANVQSVALSISSITLSNPDFSQTNNCGSSLAAHALCTISVSFTPTTVGTETATLTINDSGSNSPQTVSLTGAGK